MVGSMTRLLVYTQILEACFLQLIILVAQLLIYLSMCKEGVMCSNDIEIPMQMATHLLQGNERESL